MRLKDYSMRIKKNIAVFLHILFLFMTILSISVMYLNTNIGSGMSANMMIPQPFASSSRRIWTTCSNMLPTATSLRQTAIWISPKKCLPSAATTVRRSPTLWKRSCVTPKARGST